MQRRAARCPTRFALLELREFRRDDFAVFHPSGALGRALRTTVGELMHGGDAMPSVSHDATLREALVEVASKRLGCTCVLDADGKLVGFLSDGDLKRIFLRDAAALDQPAVKQAPTVPVSSPVSQSSPL